MNGQEKNGKNQEMTTKKSFTARHPDFFSVKLIDILAIVGIVFAYIQFNDAKHLGEETNSISNETKKILEHIQTKPMGKFPENIDSITKHILRAKDTLRIVVDYPIYGILSAPTASEKYKSAIQTKASDLCYVHLAVYNYQIRKKEFFRQFSLDEKFENNKEYFRRKYSLDKGNADKLDHFLTKHDLPRRPETLLELFELLNEFHVDFINGLKRQNVKIDTLSNPYTYNFWLVDRSELVFSLSTLGKTSEEYAYTTRDQTLIQFVITTMQNASK